MLYLVANLTPFDSRGRVDHGALRAHILWLCAQGVDGFVPTGTTGEFLYLSHQEREAVHRTVLDAARGKAVYPCTWDPSPVTTAYLCDAAKHNGAAGVLMPPALYYRLDTAAVSTWYRTLAKVVTLPILAYHNPDHLQTPIDPELYAALRKDNVLAGMKDSSADLYRLKRLASEDPEAIYGGGDRVLAEARKIPRLAGFISAIGNAWPSLCMRLFKGGEAQLEDAVLERAAAIKRAGGLRAMKALLGMGCRMPMPDPAADLVAALPPSERP